MKSILVATWLVVGVLSLAASALAAGVVLEKVPEDGVQPQVVVAPDGVAHLVYLKGERMSCDVRYTRRVSGATEWQKPMTVNSERGSAIAAGTIRGAQMALGKGGSVQVIWNGHGTAGGGHGHQTSPMLYARLDPGAQSFTPQANLLGNTAALDGGASIAANGTGFVHVVWHGLPEGKSGEAERVVLLRLSTDDGRTFAEPRALTADQPGVCSCCSLRAHISDEGVLSVLYRAATIPQERGMTWLTMAPNGSIRIQPVQEWRTPKCPMSSASMLRDARGLRGAWETDGRVFTGILGSDPSTWQAGGPKDTKHPSMAVNAKGETMIAMALGSGFAKAGKLYWRTLDRDGKPSEAATGDDLPLASFPATYARPDGTFVILH